MLFRSGISPNNCGVTDVFLNVSYNENLILASLNNALSQQDCSVGQVPKVNSVRYGFVLNITKGAATGEASNISLSYTDTTTYTYPNLLITSAQWATLITNGLNSFSFTTAFSSNSIISNTSSGTIILESTDCEQIDLVEFNLTLNNVVIQCT